MCLKQVLHKEGSDLRGDFCGLRPMRSVNLSGNHMRYERELSRGKQKSNFDLSVCEDRDRSAREDDRYLSLKQSKVDSGRIFVSVKLASR